MTYISAAMNKSRDKVLVWERTEDGKRINRSFNAPYYFYVEDANGPYKDLHGKPLKRLDFKTKWEFEEVRDEYKADGIKLFESDINPVYKILSEKYYNKPVGALNYTLFDIEVDYTPDQGFPTPEDCYAEVNAISLYHKFHDKEEMVLLVLLPKNGKWTKKDIPQDCYNLARVEVCKNEIELLTKFIEEIYDTDIISGWNSAGFDIPYMYFRLKKILGDNWADMLSLPSAPPPRVKEVEVFVGSIQKQVELYGRVHVDYLELFKKFETTTRPSFTLDAISDEILPEEKKLEFDCSLYELYNDRFPDFCRYNIRDTVVLKGFERKLGYLGIAIAGVHGSTVLLGDILGTIRLVEATIVNKCHHVLNVIVPDTKDTIMSSTKFAGALVTAPKIGWKKSIFSLDFASLYPSCIRALNISPEKIIGQFHNDFIAYEEISSKSDKVLTLIGDDITETYKAYEWADILKNRKHALSAYGTVFDQNSQGFIPEILEEWYNDRIDAKNKASEAQNKMKEILKKYKN